MSANRGGLDGVIAGTSAISEVDGTAGRLSYRGIDVRELAARSTFEETAYLLWRGRLPNRAELAALAHELANCRELPKPVQRMILGFPEAARPMDVLRTAVSALSAYDPERHQGDENLACAIMVTSRVPVIVASSRRARWELDPIPSRLDLDLAANFLYALHGRFPTERMARIMDVCLILHADHEFNASTFAARIAAATFTDLYACVTAAIGTLAGPLHGGANEQVMEMLRVIGDPASADGYILSLLAQGKRVPGFGHRVYKTEDPRAAVLRQLSAELAEETGETRWYEMSRRIEDLMIREKGINANVDFYSASVYHYLGIPTDLFTPVFAISRMVGWTAHILEQRANNRLIRPRAEYVGARGVPYVPMEDRTELVRA